MKVACACGLWLGLCGGSPFALADRPLLPPSDLDRPSAAASPAPEAISDWTRFRGPNGSGIAPARNLPAEFSAEKNCLWRVAVPSGHSSPVAHGGKIFLTAADDTGSLLTLALDQATGRELWRQAAPRSRQETLDPRNHPASPTPVVGPRGVYVFFPDFGLLAYTHDGEPLWEHALGPFTNLYGMGSSPILAGDRLILLCDQNVGSYLAAFDVQTGAELWKSARPEATSGHCTPIVYQPAPEAEPQIIAVGSFYTTAYDPRDGRKLWWVGGLSFEMKSTPVIDGDRLFINGYGSPQNEIDAEIRVDDFEVVQKQKDADGDGLLAAGELSDPLAENFFPAIDLDASGKLDAAEWRYYQASLASKNSLMAIRMGGEGDQTQSHVLWKYYRNIPQLPSPVLADGLLWMITDQGIVSCIDTAAGTLVKRGRLAGAPGNVYSSPVLADGKIYFITEAGRVAVTRADRDFEVLAVNDLGERCYATPMIDGERLYVRTEKTLYAFGTPAPCP